MGRYRRRLDIIADILNVVSQNAKKTQIMYKANLSYKLLTRYLSEVRESSLIDFECDEQYYVLTEKGREFLEAYKDYERTNKNVKKHLNDVNNKKKTLEALCSSM